MIPRPPIPRQRRARRLSRRAASLALAAAIATSALADGTITLRPVARLHADAPVRITDIADLRGSLPDTLAHVVLQPSSLRDGRVSVHEVRDAIDAAGTVNWGRISLSGADCRIVRLDAPSGHAHDRPPEPDPSPRTGQTSEPIVRDLIAPRVAQSLGIDQGHLRLTFDQSDAADAILTMPTRGRTVEIRPIGRSDTAPIAITLYERGTIVARASVRARVEVLREVAVSRVEIDRGAPIDQTLVERRHEWLPLSERHADPDALADAVARSRIPPGRILTEQSVQGAIAVKRGDPVVIHCISGDFVMKLRARATTDARIGQTIPFAPLDGRKGRTILARVERPGIAIAADDHSQTDQEPTP
ncbi:MAG: flagellar basal body P-ring formation protein FlgA [Phycisphaeraceae bacterium]|nr:flagellar basal body P-ring formation protein FlgA [Phycisphaeraceae bacterium]